MMIRMKFIYTQRTDPLDEFQFVDVSALSRAKLFNDMPSDFLSPMLFLRDLYLRLSAPVETHIQGVRKRRPLK